MNGLFYLGHLVYLKNELNRKRRRFYYYWSDCSWHREHTIVGGAKWHKGFMTKKQAWDGYKKAQSDMKSMTAHMRQIRKEIGASLIWGDSGNIIAIELDNKQYAKNQIQRLHECYIADSILLGDNYEES
jgi:hypothetical protein